MTNSLQPKGGPRAHELRAQQRAQAFFDIYMMLGPDRSLEKLHGLLASGGLSVALNTIKNYSANYNWQQRIRDAHNQAQAQADETRFETLGEMNTRQAQLGEAAQRLGGIYIRNIFDRLRDDPASVQGSPADIARLMSEGSRLERLARGEVTSRTEAHAYAYTVMVNQIIEVFANVVQQHALPQVVIDDFAAGADAVVTTAMLKASSDEDA